MFDAACAGSFLMTQAQKHNHEMKANKGTVIAMATYQMESKYSLQPRALVVSGNQAWVDNCVLGSLASDLPPENDRDLSRLAMRCCLVRLACIRCMWDRLQNTRQVGQAADKCHGVVRVWT
ncbi:hypothetical protein A5712_10105 [Mycobacterium sp. E2327]|nr:hypothetical protein A5712_10105 [Mycobacterium sp. E2327]